MNRRILIQQPDPHSPPVAVVPSTYMWDLVEYLAYQRTRVHYSYDADHFEVCFLHLDAAAAQRLLDRWISADSVLVEEPRIRAHEALTASS